MATDSKAAAAASAQAAAATAGPDQPVIDKAALAKAARKNHGVATMRIIRPDSNGGPIEAGEEVALSDFSEKDMQALIDSGAVVKKGVNDDSTG